MYNVSAHQLLQYYQTQQVPTTAWTAQISTYQNIAKLLIQLNIKITKDLIGKEL